MIVRFGVTALLASVVALASAWNDTGHMTIAAIARKDLTAAAAAEADRLLAIDPPKRAEDFLSAACWADDVRSRRRETGPWHYYDIHFRSDGKVTNNKPEAENAVVAIERFEAVLANKKSPDADRAEALRFLIHFVGDLHQPLHGSSRDSDAHPTGDRGGNDFAILPAVALTGISRPPRNLHSLWDLGGGLFVGDRRPLTDASRAHIEALATSLRAKYPSRSIRSIRDLRPLTWAQESCDVARKIAYDLQENTAPGEAYLQAAQDASGRRVATAGYRLASLLNRIL